MKIIVVAMAKDEEVFIESSVRYWFTFADQIIIFNHQSTDGTTAILQDLAGEFDGRLVLFTPSFSVGIERNQEVFTNAMVEAAFRQYGADLVIALDTDEYPYLPQGGSVRDFLCGLSQETCYKAYWMPFAPPETDQLDPSVFAPLGFTRKKCVPMKDWEKTIITRECYEQYRPMLSAGNHTFLGSGTDPLPPREDLSPRLFYAHYSCRGKSHYLLKNLRGWLSIYSQSTWQPGHSLHYQLACEDILRANGNVAPEILDWYALSTNGMTGESVEEIQNCMETIDPGSLFPEIPIRYTPKHIVNKDPIILIFESAMMITEQYRNSCMTKQTVAELQAIVTKTQAELTESRIAVAEARTALAETQDTLRNVRDTLNGVITSKSWRITAVLRKCTAWLRRRHK